MAALSSRWLVIMLLAAVAVGCKSTSNMFGWNRKKASDSSLAEAPKYDGKLPSSGQTPGGPVTNVPQSPYMNGGNQVASNPAAGTAGAAAPGATPPGGNYAMPAGYTQSPYPTTPHSAPQFGAANGAGGAPANNWNATPSNNWASTPGSPGPAVGYGAGSPPTGVAAPAAGGSLNGQPPTGLAYGTPPAGAAPAGAAPAGTMQPQQGFYNPAYNGAAPVTAATGAPDYRTADTRGYTGAAAPPSAGAAPAASPVGDRYSNVPAVDPFINAAPVAPATAGAAPPNTTAPVDPMVGDRYSTPYTQPASDYRPGNTGYNPPANVSPNAAAAGATGMPARPDANYRPGGTGTYQPTNNLRPAAPATTPDVRGAVSGGGVMPASHLVPISDAPTAPAGAAPAESPSTDPAIQTISPTADSYGSYQGASNDSSARYSTQPAYGDSYGQPQPGMFGN